MKGEDTVSLRPVHLSRKPASREPSKSEAGCQLEVRPAARCWVSLRSSPHPTPVHERCHRHELLTTRYREMPPEGGTSSGPETVACAICHRRWYTVEAWRSRPRPDDRDDPRCSEEERDADGVQHRPTLPAAHRPCGDSAAFSQNLHDSGQSREPPPGPGRVRRLTRAQWCFTMSCAATCGALDELPTVHRDGLGAWTRDRQSGKAPLIPRLRVA